MTRLSIEEWQRLTTPYLVLQVDQIPSRITLRRLLIRIAPFARHIVGCARAADYSTQLRGSTIYFICTSSIEAGFLEQVYIDFVGDGRDAQALTIVDSVLGRAALGEAEAAMHYEGVPVTIYVKGLKRLYWYDSATEYLIRIVSHFEDRGAVTAIRLNYDAIHETTRTDGFITYLNQVDARAMAGVTEPVYHGIQEEWISAVLSTNIPLIIRIPDASILINGRVNWSQEVARINQLMTSHQRRVIHPRITGPGESQSSSSQSASATSTIQAGIAQPTASTSNSRAIHPPQTLDQPGTSASTSEESKGKRKASQSEPKDDEWDRLSTNAVWGLKNATTGPFMYVYDSDEESAYNTDGKLPEPTLMMQEAPTQPVDTEVSEAAKRVESDWEDDGQLIIDEEVALEDDDNW